MSHRARSPFHNRVRNLPVISAVMSETREHWRDLGRRLDRKDRRLAIGGNSSRCGGIATASFQRPLQHPDRVDIDDEMDAACAGA